MFRSHTPPFIDAENSIASLEKIHIGGCEQYVLIRGRDKQNPLLLFLHGGPGLAQIGFARPFQQPLEDHFTVVNWDQRGAGKSFHLGLSKKTMTIQQLLADTNELIQLLLARFQKRKIYIIGYSWGTVLGMLTAKRHPDLVEAYIGIGQVVNMYENELLMYRYLMDCAQNENNTLAVASLKQIGPPPYHTMRSRYILRIWLGVFGGAVREGKTYASFILRGMLGSEYTWTDWLKASLGSSFSSVLWNDFSRIDFFSTIREVHVPVYFCTSRTDYQTPYTIVQEYYDRLQAPLKELIWFKQSAHSPNFEVPRQFCEQMLKIKTRHTHA